MSTVGDIMSTLGGVQYTGGYHEYTKEYNDKCGGRLLGKQLNLYVNPSVLNIPWCTHDTPTHTRHGIPQCTHGIPSVLNTPDVLMTSPSVLNTPRCTQ